MKKQISVVNRWKSRLASLFRFQNSLNFETLNFLSFAFQFLVRQTFCAVFGCRKVCGLWSLLELFLRFFQSAKTTIYRTKRLTCKNHHTKGIRKNLRQTFYAVYGSFPIVLLWFFFETRMTFFCVFFWKHIPHKSLTRESSNFLSVFEVSETSNFLASRGPLCCLIGPFNCYTYYMYLPRAIKVLCESPN